MLVALLDGHRAELVADALVARVVQLPDEMHQARGPAAGGGPSVDSRERDVERPRAIYADPLDKARAITRASSAQTSPYRASRLSARQTALSDGSLPAPITAASSVGSSASPARRCNDRRRMTAVGPTMCVQHRSRYGPPMSIARSRTAGAGWSTTWTDTPGRTGRATRPGPGGLLAARPGDAEGKTAGSVGPSGPVNPQRLPRWPCSSHAAATAARQNCWRAM